MNLRVREKENEMKYLVNKEDCISCGMCARTCPEVFFMDEDGKASAIEEDAPESALEMADVAKDFCPGEAITAEEA